jgi:DNA polymerase-3 subunit delta
MKTTIQKLPGVLAAGTYPVYLVSGDDPLLVQESASAVRQNLRAAGFSERELFHAEGNFDWQQVLFAANSLSLFADKKIIEVRLPSGKPGDKGGKAILSYLERPTDANALVMILPRLDGASLRAKWLKAIEKAGPVVQVWPIEGKELPRWVDARFKAAGLSATPDAVALLADRVEGNLLAAVQEIEKLKLLVAGTHVDVDEVDASVEDSARYSVFGLIDAALDGDLARSVRMAQGLRAEGAEVLFLTAMLAREVRQLLKMGGAVASGQRPDDVIKRYRVIFKRAGAVKRALARHNGRSLHGMLTRLVVIDKVVKGIEPGDAWNELIGLVISLGSRPESVRRG